MCLRKSPEAASAVAGRFLRTPTVCCIQRLRLPPPPACKVPLATHQALPILFSQRGLIVTSSGLLIFVSINMENKGGWERTWCGKAHCSPEGKVRTRTLPLLATCSCCEPSGPPLGVVLPCAEPSERVTLRSSRWIHVKAESRKIHFVRSGKEEMMLWQRWPPARHCLHMGH